VKPLGTVTASVQVCDAISVLVGNVSVVHCSRPSSDGAATCAVGNSSVSRALRAIRFSKFAETAAPEPELPESWPTSNGLRVVSLWEE
jgi:hypothetical protein